MAAGPGKTKVDAVQQWLRLRKNTVIAHWLYGGLCGAVAAMFFPAGLSMLTAFGVWEAWNDRNMARRCLDYKPEGDLDCWEAACMATVVFSILFVLSLFGLVSIRWC